MYMISVNLLALIQLSFGFFMLLDSSAYHVYVGANDIRRLGMPIRVTRIKKVCIIIDFE